MPEHTLRVMNSRGDTAVRWTEDDPASVAKAREVFDDLFRRGHAIFRAQYAGAMPASKITEFDASVRELVAVPPIAGG